MTSSNSAPVITSQSTFTVAENQTSVAAIVASDADGDTLTYNIGGTDVSHLELIKFGVLTFNTAPDHETKKAIVLNYSN